MQGRLQTQASTHWQCLMCATSTWQRGGRSVCRPEVMAVGLKSSRFLLCSSFFGLPCDAVPPRWLRTKLRRGRRLSARRLTKAEAVRHHTTSGDGPSSAVIEAAPVAFPAYRAGATRQCSELVASTTLSQQSSGLAAKSNVSSDQLAVGLVITQIVTLVGALVGGHLARKRRLELQHLNGKLREVRSALAAQAALCVGCVLILQSCHRRDGVYRHSVPRKSAQTASWCSRSIASALSSAEPTVPHWNTSRASSASAGAGT
jgi:hypothetical protein